MHDPTDPEFDAAAKALCELADAADIINRALERAENRFKDRFAPHVRDIYATPTRIQATVGEPVPGASLLETLYDTAEVDL